MFNQDDLRLGVDVANLAKRAHIMSLGVVGRTAMGMGTQKGEGKGMGDPPARRPRPMQFPTTGCLELTGQPSMATTTCWPRSTSSCRVWIFTLGTVRSWGEKRTRLDCFCLGGSRMPQYCLHRRRTMPVGRRKDGACCWQQGEWKSGRGEAGGNGNSGKERGPTTAKETIGASDQARMQTRSYVRHQTCIQTRRHAPIPVQRTDDSASGLDAILSHHGIVFNLAALNEKARIVLPLHNTWKKRKKKATTQGCCPSSSGSSRRGEQGNQTTTHQRARPISLC